MTVAPSGASTLPTAATVSPSINTSPANSPSAVTTVPLAINVVSVIAPLLLAEVCSAWDPHVLGADPEDVAEPPDEVVEKRRVADQRRRDLDDRVAAVVAARDQLGADQRLGQALSEQFLALLCIEAALGPVGDE